MSCQSKVGDEKFFESVSGKDKLQSLECAHRGYRLIVTRRLTSREPIQRHEQVRYPKRELDA